ncbi:MAG: preprotein translocase subunit SecY [Flavobacteriales bacterium]|nr:preprotein translocase subunit SecY [Flavobacteriales bacterium]
MKDLFSTIGNIFKIEELRGRILTTLSLVLVYRLGSFIVLPGIDSEVLAAQAQGSSGSVLDILVSFTGGAFSRASIFALGIMPYISASIIVQLLGIAVPYFQKLQKEGESGRTRLNQITRGLTVLITAFQAPGYLTTQVPLMARPDSALWWTMAITLLVSGTIFCMWLGERITDKGIGNGISILIMIGIIANLPTAFIVEFGSKMEADGGGLILFILEIVLLLAVIVLSILLVQGTRRIPIQFAKRLVGGGVKQAGGRREFLPLKVNAAGVMPIIFAQAIMFVPIYLVGFADSGGGSWIARNFQDFTTLPYNFTFALMIVLFTYFYTAITVNPNQIADDLKRSGGFIPGIRPGKNTAEYIDNVMSRITLPGSLFLALIAILPAFASLANINTALAYFYGGTSLLIMVGVVLDTLSQIDSHLKMREMDGLMKSGRIKGRSTTSVSI